MPRKKNNNLLDLPALELECMKALWALEQATVEEVRAHLMPARPLAYTTVLTVMDRLARKGAAERRKRGRAHVYTAAVAENSVRERALERLIADFFEGSRDRLRSYLAGAPAAEPKRTGSDERPRPVTRSLPKPGSAVPHVTGIDTSLL
jgi:BlaI family transcriptional regulator, penicillinase repressor